MAANASRWSVAVLVALMMIFSGVVFRLASDEIHDTRADICDYVAAHLTASQRRAQDPARLQDEASDRQLLARLGCPGQQLGGR